MCTGLTSSQLAIKSSAQLSYHLSSIFFALCFFVGRRHAMEIQRYPSPCYGCVAYHPQASHFMWDSSATTTILQCDTDFYRSSSSMLQTEAMAPHEEAASSCELCNPQPPLDAVNALHIDTVRRFNDEMLCQVMDCSTKSPIPSSLSPVHYARTSNVLLHPSCNEFGSYSDLSSCQTSPSAYSPNSYSSSPSISCCSSPLPPVPLPRTYEQLFITSPFDPFTRSFEQMFLSPVVEQLLFPFTTCALLWAPEQ